MHTRHLMHRDLKPSNVLIAADGHVQLGDLGLTALVRSPAIPAAAAVTLRSIVGDGGVPPTALQGRAGTPGFWAPEMLRRHSAASTSPRHYDASADFWSYGCLLYAMLVGQSPFPEVKDQDPHVTATGRLDIPLWLSKSSPAAEDLLRKLLVVDPAARLGSRAGDFRRLRKHPWFSGVDWRAMRTRNAVPPWVPSVPALKIKCGAFEDDTDGDGGAAPAAASFHDQLVWDSVPFQCKHAAAIEVMTNSELRNHAKELESLLLRQASAPAPAALAASSPDVENMLRAEPAEA